MLKQTTTRLAHQFLADCGGDATFLTRRTRLVHPLLSDLVRNPAGDIPALDTLRRQVQVQPVQVP